MNVTQKDKSGRYSKNRQLVQRRAEGASYRRLSLSRLWCDHDLPICKDSNPCPSSQEWNLLNTNDFLVVVLKSILSVIAM